MSSLRGAYRFRDFAAFIKHRRWWFYETTPPIDHGETRITEGGDRRITEDGNVRITE